MKLFSISVLALSLTLAPASAQQNFRKQAVDACIGKGDNPALCRCTVKVMKAELDKKAFREFVRITVADDPIAGSTFMQEQYANDPSLVDTLVPALNACQAVMPKRKRKTRVSE